MNEKILNTNGFSFRSTEELHFYWYLLELKENGFISDFRYEAKTYSLFEPVKVDWYKYGKRKNSLVQTHLMNGSDYTPDFEIDWLPKADGIFYSKEKPMIKVPSFIPQVINDIPFQIPDILSTIDVKGNTGSQFVYKNTSSVTFPIKQKALWAIHKIYAQKIVPIDLFASTFVPKRFLFTDAEKGSHKRSMPKKIKRVILLDEFVKSKQIG